MVFITRYNVKLVNLIIVSDNVAHWISRFTFDDNPI